MVNNPKIAVTTVAFSKNNFLREELSKAFLHVKFNNSLKRFTKEELKSFLKEADGAIVGLDNIDEELLSHLDHLQIISKYGVGLNNIDFEACQKHNVHVAYTQGVNKRSVAELALGNMLSLCRNSYISSNLLKQSIWEKNGGIQLSGKTVGIIGVGHIGKDLIALLKPFGCTILVNDIIEQKIYYEANGLIEVSKEKLFQQSDVVTIHTPATPKTQGMINKQTLSLMKKTAFFINTARGDMVIQDDLKWALQQGVIAGAAIDVYNEEPPVDQEFISLPNLICTPHIGGNAEEAVLAMGMSAIDNLKEFFH